MFEVNILVGSQFKSLVSIWFRLVSYFASFVHWPKIFSDHSSLVCFQFLLYLAIYFLNLLLVSLALLPDIFGCQW